MSRRLALVACVAVVAVPGCGKQNDRLRLTEKLFPPPVEIHVARIESGEADVRRKAVVAIAGSREVHKVPSLVKLLCLVAESDSDAMVRAAAARSLGHIQGQRIVPTLKQILSDDWSVPVRVDAAASLGQQGTPDALSPLVQALRGETHPDVRIAAAEALCLFKDTAAAKALVERLTDTNLAVAYKAWEGLRYMTGRNLPREPEPWEDFLASSETPFARFGKPPRLPKGESQRAHFTKTVGQFFKGLFERDVREGELE